MRASLMPLMMLWTIFPNAATMAAKALLPTSVQIQCASTGAPAKSDGEMEGTSTANAIAGHTHNASAASAGKTTVTFFMVFLSKNGSDILFSGDQPMTTMTKAKKTAKPRASKKQPLLPPSAGVTNVAGQKLLIIPLDDFEEWLEDIALSALVEERIEEGGPYISLEEFERRLDQRNKGRKK